MNEIIRAIRKSHGLSMNQFAKLLGVDVSTISRWESGDRIPQNRAEIGALLRVAQPEQQCAIIEYLGITNVEQFARDLLGSAGVDMIEVE